MEFSNLISQRQSLIVHVGGSIDGHTKVYDKAFPLVFKPADKIVNFVQLQEYFLNNHKLI